MPSPFTDPASAILLEAGKPLKRFQRALSFEHMVRVGRLANGLRCVKSLKIHSGLERVCSDQNLANRIQCSNPEPTISAHDNCRYPPQHAVHVHSDSDDLWHPSTF